MSEEATVVHEEPDGILSDVRLAAAKYSEPADLDELTEQILSEDPPTRFFGIQNLRRRVTSDDCECSYARLLQTKALQVLVDSLDNDQLPDVQYECAWILTNLLSHRQEKADLLAKGGLCQPLVRLLMSKAADRTREQACWALANIVGECAEWRDQALLNGLLPALTGLLDSQPCLGMLEAASLLLVNMFRDREPRVSFEAAKTLLPYMVSLLDHPHKSLVPHIVWAMSYMIEESEPRVQLILREDILNNLRLFLSSKDSNVLIPTLRVLCNVTTAMAFLPSCILADEMLEKMRPLLDSPDAKIRRQVLQFVSNVSDGSDSSLQRIADAGFLPRLGFTLMEADEQEKRAAAWIVPNFVITRGGKFKKMIIDSCLDGFFEILTLKDPELTHCVLLTVRELLISVLQHPEWGVSFDDLRKQIERNGGLKKIELVQTMEDKDLARMSYQIIDHFFWHNGEQFLTVQSDAAADVTDNLTAAAVSHGHNSNECSDSILSSPEPEAADQGTQAQSEPTQEDAAVPVSE